MNRLGAVEDLAKSTRAAAINQLVFFIQAEDLTSASQMLDYFNKNRQRVSREILSAYWHRIHGCSV